MPRQQPSISEICPTHVVRGSVLARAPSCSSARGFIGAWPRLMRAETAAAYVDEISVEAFRRAVGVHYPRPIEVRGKGQRWLREDLDAAIDAIAGRPKRYQTEPTETTGSPVFDAASVL